MEEEERNEWGPAGQPSVSEQLKKSGYTEGINYEQIIDDEYEFPRFNEDPTEQNRLNVRHALKKAQSGMPLTEVEQTLLINNGLDDFVLGGQTQAAGVDAALLAAPFLAKPGLLAGGLTTVGNLIKKYPGKTLEVIGAALGGASEDPQDIALETTGFKADTMFIGGRPINTGGLTRMLDWAFSSSNSIFNKANPNWRTVTPDGVEVPDTFFKSVSKGSGQIVWPTPKQVYDTKQKLMNNQLADATGKLNIWNYFKNKKGRSNWGRLMAKEVQTLPHTRSSWTSIKRELQNDFLSIYPEKFLKTIKYKNAKGKWVSLAKDSIEVEHIFTLQQSMPIFADVEWGGELWQQISRQILSKQFALGDTRQNLVAVPEHIHRIKSQYFNKMAGIDGRKFFTDDVIKQMIADPKFRTAKIDEWLDEVEKGKKIIDDGLAIWETLYKGKPIPNMPEELVEKLSKINLDEVDIKKVIPQIFAEFEAEGFTNTALKQADLATENIEKIKLNKRKILNAEHNEMVEYFEKATKQWNKQNAKFTPWDDVTDAIEYATQELKSQFIDKNGQLSFINKNGMTLEEAATIYGNLLFETNRAR
tara:strand:- start:83 stop:1843 length:1761 start_codon:yes stop_codon:yes gene_type:complete